MRTMKVSTQKALTVILAILSFPFFTAGILNGKRVLVLEKKPEMEDFLAPAVSAEVPENYPYEAVRAQAVLVRSRCLAEIEQGTKYDAVIQELVEEGESSNASGHVESVCERAVKETEHMALNYGGRVVEGPFFRSGNGTTRSGRDIFQSDGYPWLLNVESPWDIDEEDYLTPCSFTPAGLFDSLDAAEEGLSEIVFGQDCRELAAGGILGAEEIAGRFQNFVTDAAGYVTELTIGEKIFSGERLRRILNLPSSCFSVQAVDGKLRFLCKGLGHGAGLSQAGAAAMAWEGKAAEEILQHYFPSATVEMVQ